MNGGLIAILAGLLAAGVLIRLYRDWRHDTAITRRDPVSRPHLPGCLVSGPASRDEVSEELPLPRRTPGLRTDGRPLDDYEKRILGRIDMDTLITVPEPRYGHGPERGTS